MIALNLFLFPPEEGTRVQGQASHFLICNIARFAVLNLILMPSYLFLWWEVEL